MANELLLEAALVRCTQNRSETRYETECVNAREAANLIEAREVEARRAELEAQSEAKREALRRNQEAAAEARRLAEEAAQQREEAEYLSQFGDVAPDGTGELAGNVPGVVISAEPSSGEDTSYDTDSGYAQPYAQPAPTLPTAGSNAPAAELNPEPESEAVVDSAPFSEPEAEAVVETEPEDVGDLQSIRDELRRRNDDGN